MTVNRMREEIIKVYGSPSWRLRVMEMPDRQVIAVYKTMERNGRFTKKKKRTEPKFEEACVQLSIWDILKEQEKNNHE